MTTDDNNSAMTGTQIEIACVCDDIKELLLYKNQQYGDSALNPSRIFSKASAVEQLLVRIDDKLNRIKNSLKYLLSILGISIPYVLQIRLQLAIYRCSLHIPLLLVCTF